MTGRDKREPRSGGRASSARALSDPDGGRLQRQARALGDPTRHAIFRAVTDAPAPIDVATLTARFGLNHNAIRQHLAKLSDAGLVIEETAPPTGPGRRRLRYRPAPEVEGSWGTHGPYQQLSLMLLQLLQEGSSAREVGAETGRRLARALPQTADPVDRLELNATRQGFAPRRVDRGSSVELILDRCPFQAAASAAPEVVCQLHRGLAEGIAKATAGQVEVIDLISRNPQRAGCRLKLVRGTSDD